MFRRFRGTKADTSVGASASNQLAQNVEEEEKKTEEPNTGIEGVIDSSASSRSCVYQEAMEMLTGALVIYIFAELRDMARENGTLKDLEPPLTSAKVLSIIKENASTLEERAIDHEELAKRLAAFHQVEESSHNEGFLASLLDRAGVGSSRIGLSGKQDKTSPPVLTHFDDNNAEQEIVHAIAVSPAKKRITVAFRGSVTQKDFIQDAKMAQTKVENPVARLFEDPEHTTDTISIHAGFYEYITKKDPETKMTRLETILIQTKELLRQYPGFQVFCTGHSLGGALCTLFGFYASADDDIWTAMHHNPIVIYSYASPYCGNWKFRYAFMHLERLRRLQHLRTANLEDMVTLLPFFAPKATIFSPIASAVLGAGNLYKHVGLRLQLALEESRDDGKIHSVAYPKDYQSSDEDYAREVRDSLEAGKSLAKAFYALIRNDFERVKKHHSCVEYEKRLELCKGDLMNLTLGDLYLDKTIVGDVLNQEYKPVIPRGSERTKRAMNFWTSRSSSSAASLAQNK